MNVRKAQVSAELMIVMAAVLAVAILLVAQLHQTAKQGSSVLKKKADKVFQGIDAVGGLSTNKLKEVGKTCKSSSECKTDFCDPYTKTCEQP